LINATLVEVKKPIARLSAANLSQSLTPVILPNQSPYSRPLMAIRRYAYQQRLPPALAAQKQTTK
jgi:hypothetical protein